MHRTASTALGWLIVISSMLRLGWAATLETGNDEAYLYLYTVNPDWSYFDHPPMTMLVAKIGLALCGGWVHPLSLRLGFVLLFAASTWVLYRWTARQYGGWAGFFAALALNLAMYYSAAAGAFALPDGPFLFFALLTMWRLSEACRERPEVVPGERPGVLPWIWVGVAWGGAMLSKYHAVFLPAGALLFVLITPRLRRLLLTPGPYLAAGIGLLGFAPVLWWNAQHHWSSFAFQGARAGGTEFRPDGLAMWFFGPMMFLLPWIWWACIREVLPRVRRFRSTPDSERLLLCLAVVPILFFLPIACRQRILMHWPLIGFVPLLPFVGRTWSELSLRRTSVMKLRVVGMTASLLVATVTFALQARLALIPLPGADPCVEISGWESVERELANRGLLRPDTFLFTPRWYDSGQLAFAVRTRVPVLCYSPGDARGFAFWSHPEEWQGRTGYLVSMDDRPWDAEMYQPYFKRIELAGEFPMSRGDRPVRRVRVYRCDQQTQPFPFTYGPPAAAAIQACQR